MGPSYKAERSTTTLHLGREALHQGLDYEGAVSLTVRTQQQHAKRAKLGKVICPSVPHGLGIRLHQQPHQVIQLRRIAPPRGRRSMALSFGENRSAKIHFPVSAGAW